MTNVVRTLWHGDKLSIYEELSIRSFVMCGHAVEVYSYSDFEVPRGARLCDASQILPASKVFHYTVGPAKSSFAAFSNLFRFKILYERGGIWADLDILCLHNLDDLPEACAGWESEQHLNGAFLKFSQGHDACAELYARADQLGSGIALGQTAALLTRKFLEKKHGATITTLPVPAFYPIPVSDTWRFIDPTQLSYCQEHCSESYGVHWWNGMLTIGIGLSKDALPPKGSFLHDHAQRLMGTDDLPVWSADSVYPLIEPHQLSSYAKEAAIKEDWPEAVSRWQAALDAFSGREPPEAWIGLGRALRRHGELDAAEAAMERGRSRHSKALVRVPGLSTEYAEVAMARKDWATAASRFRSLIDTAGARISARTFLRAARAFRKMGDANGAGEVLQRGLSIYPGNPALVQALTEVS